MSVYATMYVRELRVNVSVCQLTPANRPGAPTGGRRETAHTRAASAPRRPDTPRAATPDLKVRGRPSRRANARSPLPPTPARRKGEGVDHSRRGGRVRGVGVLPARSKSPGRGGESTAQAAPRYGRIPGVACWASPPGYTLIGFGPWGWGKGGRTLQPAFSEAGQPWRRGGA